MNQRQALIDKLMQGITFSGEIAEDVTLFLSANSRAETAHHCEQVAAVAGALALKFNFNPVPAVQAGWLHDVSAVWPASQRLASAETFGLEILAEERHAPFILHQKLSAVLAEQVFGVSDAGVLSAVTCHTTLKAGAGVLDKLVFAADKLAWDQPGKPPYYPAMAAVLEDSLDSVCRVYLAYLWG